MPHRKIISAAIRVRGGLIISLPKPARHHDILQRDLFLFNRIRGQVQGFLTSDGKFVDRIKAKEIAEKANQLRIRSDDSYQGEELFTEGLW